MKDGGREEDALTKKTLLPQSDRVMSNILEERKEAVGDGQGKHWKVPKV